MTEYELPDRLNERLSLAANVTERYLTEDGIIDYHALSPEQLEALAQVGPVTELAAQKPIHLLPPTIFTDEESGKSEVIITADEQFFNDSNNFSMHFCTTGMGAVYRDMAHARRFRALFPEFDELLVAKRSAFQQAHRKAATERNYSYQDIAYQQALRTAYAVMSQLVDENDYAGGAKTVRESHNRHYMLIA